jgi:protein O-mannosyl-transferase
MPPVGTKRKRARGRKASRPAATPASAVPSWVFLALVAAAVLLVYYPVLGHTFLLWDDTVHVSENPHILNTAFFWTTPYQGIYMPITYSIWSATVRLFGLTPGPLHAINMGLHLGCALLVFALLRRLLAALPDGEAPDATRITLGAGLGALLFALHPVQVEPVSWITSLKDMASGLFALTALLFMVRHLQGQGGRLGQVLAGLAFLCALLCKPVTVSVILMAGAMGWLVLRLPLDRLARALAPWAVLAVPLLLLTGRAQGRLTMLYESPALLRPLIALDSLGFYLGKVFFPLDISPAYGRSARAVIEAGEVYWTWLPGAIFLVGAVLLRRRLPALLPAAAIFISGFVLVSGLMPFAAQDNTTVYDRYLYLAMLGPALALGWVIVRARRRTLVVAVAAVVLLAFGIKSGAQTRWWRDDISLWSATLERRPESPVALINLGFANNQRGDKARALELYGKAVKAAPRDPQARNNMGAMLAEQGRLDLALVEFQASLAADPDNADAHHNMGKLQLKQGKYPEAEQHLKKVLTRSPRHLEAALDMGELYLRAGRMDLCVRYMRQVVGWHPKPDAPLLLGVALARTGNLKGATAAFRRVLAMDPNNAIARANLARAEADLAKK